MSLTGWTDEELIIERDRLRDELKAFSDEINARRKAATKETIRLAALSNEEAGARLRQIEPDDLPFD